MTAYAHRLIAPGTPVWVITNRRPRVVCPICAGERTLRGVTGATAACSHCRGSGQVDDNRLEWYVQPCKVHRVSLYEDLQSYELRTMNEGYVARYYYLNDTCIEASLYETATDAQTACNAANDIEASRPPEEVPQCATPPPA